jgi:D-serine deaminase-like pyridoxal phosphate-dependent protein
MHVGTANLFIWPRQKAIVRQDGDQLLRISQVPTPVPVIDLDVLGRNLQRAVETCRSYHVAYRPHVKTHKMTALARMQMDAGACGITCAKIGEAEVMANAGLQDIFISCCLVDRLRFERLARLAHCCRMSVGVDSRQAAQALSNFFSAHDQSLDVLMEVDTGHHRCGVGPDDACDFAQFLVALRGIRLKGIFTHEGHVYQPGSAEERFAHAEEAGRRMARVASILRERGTTTDVVSVGSSPAREGACRVAGVTENRPGTNIFNDCTQVHLGSCELSDCALSYECTVVSRPASDRAVIDGGSKTFSSDQLSDWQGAGVVKGFPGAKFSRASEEHGILFLSDGHSQSLQVGDRVRVIPSHACGSINLHDRAFGEKNGEIVHEWKIEARGCVQ